MTTNPRDYYTYKVCFNKEDEDMVEEESWERYIIRKKMEQVEELKDKANNMPYCGRSWLEFKTHYQYTHDGCKEKLSDAELWKRYVYYRKSIGMELGPDEKTWKELGVAVTPDKEEKPSELTAGEPKLNDCIKEDDWYAAVELDPETNKVIRLLAVPLTCDCMDLPPNTYPLYYPGFNEYVILVPQTETVGLGLLLLKRDGSFHTVSPAEEDKMVLERLYMHLGKGGAMERYIFYITKHNGKYIRVHQKMLKPKEVTNDDIMPAPEPEQNVKHVPPELDDSDDDDDDDLGRDIYGHLVHKHWVKKRKPGDPYAVWSDGLDMSKWFNKTE